RRRVPALALRQPEERSEEDSAGTSAGGDGALDRVPLALGISNRVLQPGTVQREGGRGRRSRLLSPDSSGADSAGEEPTGVESVFAKLRESADELLLETIAAADAPASETAAGLCRDLPACRVLSVMLRN